jgi:hypothetical protein
MTVRGLPLSKIAISSGFANQSHFTRVFSAAVDVSPGAWRREAHGRWLGTETRRNPGLNVLSRSKRCRRPASFPKRPCLVQSCVPSLLPWLIQPSSLLKNLEMGVFSFLPAVVLGRRGGVGRNFLAWCWVYPDAGWLSGKQFGNADQVIGDQIEQEVGGDASNAAMFGLAHGAMLLAPSEDALDHRPA